MIDIKGIVITCGNYGSGKTEISVNLAIARKMNGIDVKIADLDLINPYFRTREAKELLENLGIIVISPDKQYTHSILPVLSPAVAGMIQHPSELTILDTGGDDVGVTVLAALGNHLANQNFHMLLVINSLRPFTHDVKGCIQIKEKIETASKLKITGLVGNTNLIDETTPKHIYNGYDLLKDVSRETGLKIEFITACSYLIPQLEMDHFACPVLEINRKLAPPWKQF